MEGYALSTCAFMKQSLIVGTLRQNYIVLDPIKQKMSKISSSFLNIHPTFQNIRVNSNNKDILLFSNNRISVLDNYHCFKNELVASQNLEDVHFAGDYRVLGVSKDCLFQWDLRNWRLVNRIMRYNAFTKLWSNGDIVAIGNKLGVLSLSTIQQQFKEYAEVSALVTHVTDLKGNKNGDLLLQCSKWKKNAVRLIDGKKGRVISGWP